MLQVCPECRQPVDPRDAETVYAARPVQPEWAGDSEYVDGLGDYLHERCLQLSARPWRRTSRKSLEPALP